METTVAIAWDRWLPAPAKLNLFLHVIGRRSDGYHRLQTVFQLIDRADRLRFTRRDDGAIRLAQPLPGIAEPTDLVIRAARRLAEAADRPVSGVTIAVDKNIPIGGGLGGGSSDAATTLVALNTLWALNFSRERLAAIGLALGADVPVFVQGDNAWAEGIGERLTPIALRARAYVVVVPQVSVPTREIFADPALTRDTEETTMATFFAEQNEATRTPASTAGNPSLWGRNDLEIIVLRRYPDVARCHAWLAQFGAARMTGSGSCVFVECADEASAAAIVARQPADMHGFVAHGLTRHPLAVAS